MSTMTRDQYISIARAQEFKRIYVASPYTHPDPMIRGRRCSLVVNFAAHLIKHGLVVYVPVPHYEAIYGVLDSWNCRPTEDEIDEMNRSFLVNWATHLVVYAIDGWTTSRGVWVEMELAKQLGIEPVTVECDS